MLIGQNHPSLGKFSPITTPELEAAYFPLGAHFDGKDVTFAVYSKHASHILLELYQNATGEDAIHDYFLVKNPGDDIWRIKLKDIPKNTLYAFRCWGSNWQFDENWHRRGCELGFIADVDQFGHRFNPNKLLFDPYTREMSHDKVTPEMESAGQNGYIYSTGGGDYQGKVRRFVDTAHWAPKSVVIKDKTSIGMHPYNCPEEASIYEAHVRGLTQHKSACQLGDILAQVGGFEGVVNIPDELRGTYKGAAMMAKYIKSIGFTAIEFLPVHETENATNGDSEPKGNYWGYMTYGYFSPDRRYAYDQSLGGPTKEFKQMVKAFHDEGIEVYLDVVYNHTGEGGNWGDNDVTGFVSFGGFDVTEYYQLTEHHYLVDGATGCGNQLNFSNEVTQNLVIDSLTYWLEEMGVDGFRFDLAPVLGRHPDQHQKEDWDGQKQFYVDHPLLKRIKELGDKYKAEMIAEAWDNWGSQVGNFPAGWAEWNGHYRDSVRDFLKGSGDKDNFIRMVNGDYSNFNDNGGPQKSINFVVAHDGFNLLDLVSYNQKNNEQLWPFGPSDGGNSDNRSWDSGGDHALRRQRVRNFWAVQFISRGIPMVVWGDEFGRTQNGNNNPYNIDSVATWNNYAMIGTRSPNQIETGYGGSYHDNFGTANGEGECNPQFIFSSYMAKLRRDRPSLKQRNYGDMALDSGNDVTYLFRKTDGYSQLDSCDKCIWLRIDGSEVGDNDLLVMINMHHEKVPFTVPAGIDKKWARLVDTASWAEKKQNCWSRDEAELIENNYFVHPQSVVVLEELAV